jgi:hypothetical protein
VWRNDLMEKRNFLPIIVCLVISIFLSIEFDYTDSKIINYDTILNLEIAFFSVSLAIVALMITVLEKYKEKVSDLGKWSKYSASIMKEMSDNTVALLIIIIMLILSSIAETIFDLFPCVNLMAVVLLFCTILSLIIMLDTTISVHKLVINLKDLLAEESFSNENLSQREMHIIEAYRFLNDQNRNSFEDLLRGLTTNQQLDSKDK